MSSKKFISYQGYDYRDDRMFVMNIATATKDVGTLQHTETQ